MNKKILAPALGVLALSGVVRAGLTLTTDWRTLLHVLISIPDNTNFLYSYLRGFSA